jgi:hypothetical protein
MLKSDHEAKFRVSGLEFRVTAFEREPSDLLAEAALTQLVDTRNPAFDRFYDDSRLNSFGPGHIYTTGDL